MKSGVPASAQSRGGITHLSASVGRNQAQGKMQVPFITLKPAESSGSHRFIHSYLFLQTNFSPNDLEKKNQNASVPLPKAMPRFTFYCCLHPGHLLWHLQPQEGNVPFRPDKRANASSCSSPISPESSIGFCCSQITPCLCLSWLWDARTSRHCQFVRV